MEILLLLLILLIALPLIILLRMLRRLERVIQGDDMNKLSKGLIVTAVGIIASRVARKYAKKLL